MLVKFYMAIVKSEINLEQLLLQTVVIQSAFGNAAYVSIQGDAQWEDYRITHTSVSTSVQEAISACPQGALYHLLDQSLITLERAKIDAQAMLMTSPF